MTGRHRGPARRQLWPFSELLIAVIFIAGVACCTFTAVGLYIYGAGVL